jgi:hypothetical protein
MASASSVHRVLGTTMAALHAVRSALPNVSTIINTSNTHHRKLDTVAVKSLLTSLSCHYPSIWYHGVSSCQGPHLFRIPFPAFCVSSFLH